MAPVIATAATKAVQLASDPKVRAKLTEYYKAATGKVVDFANPVAANAVINKGPAPAAVVLKGLVRAGINPDDIFEGVILREQADAATKRLMDELRSTYVQVSAALDSRSAIHSNGNIAEALFKKEIILFAQQKFGSPNAIREAHAKMRAFLSMDVQALEEGLALHLGR